MEVAHLVLHVIETCVAIAAVMITIWPRPGNGRHRRER